MSDSQMAPIFVDYSLPIQNPSPIRQKITEAYRLAEKTCLIPLMTEASFDGETKTQIAQIARQLIEKLRSKNKGKGVEGLVQEYSLSSDEGVALMCLAEALLRIPDKFTRDALIRDKIVKGNWKSHLGSDKSLFVNATTWALIITGKLSSPTHNNNLISCVTRVVKRWGEPIIRKSIDIAMRMMGEQFVRGQTIEEALKNSKPLEARGFRYSYDMLGEAAITKEDADRYFKDYETAIHAIGQASKGRGVYQGPGISIKLSALHPRYSRSQPQRVMHELLPRVKHLSVLCKNYDIGFNIDAEEADRLELSLDLLENICFDSDLKDWEGIGFVVQAYGRRCPFVLDYLIDLAQRSHHRLMVRLVKGAYWDAEIKRAQVDGLESFPVYTRKVYTDVSYIACAKKLLQVPEYIFPQFATHNAQTLATIYTLAGSEYSYDKYEFQCLHGMGEPLYDEVVGQDKLNRPARIYAPVGTHETLLAYLVRRLLENGANSSFVNQIADKTISIDDMIADPVDVVQALEKPFSQHPAIVSPSDLFMPSRQNSCGYDLSNESVLSSLNKIFYQSTKENYKAGLNTKKPQLAPTKILNPADRRDIVGEVNFASVKEAEKTIKTAYEAYPDWSKQLVKTRVDILQKAADLFQQRMPQLLPLIAREAGKSIPNAIAEVRETIDFLRFYSAEAQSTLKDESKSIGVVVCISPWNFPLSIFAGQISAALVAGNTVLAKPAEETPLIAAQCVAILHEAGIPENVLQLVPGDGEIGAALVSDSNVAGVMFTGSTEVARFIQKTLSKRLNKEGKPIAFIAETGGQNAMIVDSSALAEQVVLDAIMSAFDSAGQRCSALRVLCLQDEVAERIITMLKGAMNELKVGRTDQINVDVGPVISTQAQKSLNHHIETMSKLGAKVHQLDLGDLNDYGTFVAPTLIELKSIKELKHEVFGPILHIVRFKRKDLNNLIDSINQLGYGLTFGLHTRLDDVVDNVNARIKVGNIYINRNVIGAVVGSQPFGGRGLSGTGPKAGGALYLSRLMSDFIEPNLPKANAKLENLQKFAQWLEQNGKIDAAHFAQSIATKSNLGLTLDLKGPVGEKNTYHLHQRGKIILMPRSEEGLYRQLACVLATGNKAIIDGLCALQNSLKNLPIPLQKDIIWSQNMEDLGPFAGALIEAEGEALIDQLGRLEALSGPLILTQSASPEDLKTQELPYSLNLLLEELSISVNTTAAGGNASLMTIDG